MSNTEAVELLVQSDLVDLSEQLGGALLYHTDADSGLVAVQLNDDGDEVARYTVNVSLQRIEDTP
jgi:hypothetical protein